MVSEAASEAQEGKS